MAKVHVLDGPKAGLVNVLLHFLTPAGNNDAAMTWRAVLDSVGILGQHTGVDIVDAAEITQIENGDVIEIPATLHTADGDTSGPGIIADANKEISAWKQNMADQYVDYGRSGGTVD